MDQNIISNTLELTFGNEWYGLSREDQANILRDYSDGLEEDGLSAVEYRRRIGKGNLQSYAEVMRVRAKKGW